LDHSSVYALSSLGWCKLYFGSIDEVIALVEQVIRLSPRAGDLFSSIARLKAHPDAWLGVPKIRADIEV
jgi:hypothetical protein